MEKRRTKQKKNIIMNYSSRSSWKSTDTVIIFNREFFFFLYSSPFLILSVRLFTWLFLSSLGHRDSSTGVLYSNFIQLLHTGVSLQIYKIIIIIIMMIKRKKFKTHRNIFRAFFLLSALKGLTSTTVTLCWYLKKWTKWDLITSSRRV